MLDQIDTKILRELQADGRSVEEKVLRLPGVKDASSSIMLDRIKAGSADLP